MPDFLPDEGDLEEETKVALRNIRRKARQTLSLPADPLRKAEKELQAMTDRYVSQVATLADNKVASL
jgi:ribosome recycling factor